MNPVPPHGGAASLGGQPARNSDRGRDREREWGGGGGGGGGGVFRQHHGRRWLVDASYPLPVDLTELHRQSLKTLMMMGVFGAPFCNPYFDGERPPSKVLDVCCGSGLWSGACHDFFARRGHANISFTGIDVAPLCPDLGRSGMDWRFVRHDIRQRPFPFADDEFDFIFVKECSFSLETADRTASPFAETLRVLRPGGVLEIWDTDHVFRALLPNPQAPMGASREETDQASATATYLIAPGTAFAPAQNQYLAEYNEWAESGLYKLGFKAAPCPLTAWAFQMDPENFYGAGSRRVAIPFSETRWEEEQRGGGGSGGGDEEAEEGEEGVMGEEEEGKEKEKGEEGKEGKEKKEGNEGKEDDDDDDDDEGEDGARRSKGLTKYQSSLRQTALRISLDHVAALEPILRAENGKGQDEWDRWFAGLTNCLLKENGTYNGECLETGSWWARRTGNAPNAA